jgi:hypothetical protein
MVATSTAVAAPEPKASAAARPVAAAPPADGSVTLPLKNATVVWDCPVELQDRGRRYCTLYRVVSVTLTSGFAILTQDTGVRTIISGERLFSLVDVATVVEKP